MEDRDGWRERIREIHAGGVTCWWWWKLLGDIRSWHHQTTGYERKKLKETISKEPDVVRDKTLLQKPYQRNEYLGCTLVRYSEPFLKWTREYLKQMDIRTSKLMNKALHPRDDDCVEYVLRSSIDKMKDNGFKLVKDRNRRYLTQTIINANYTDDIVLPANTPAQAETLLHCRGKKGGRRLSSIEDSINTSIQWLEDC